MPAARYSDGEYARENVDWHDQDAAWKAGQIADMIRDQGLAPRSVCDIGCGAGGVLASLTERMPGTDLVGYDVSPQAVELAGKLHPEIDVRLGQPPAGEHYELVLLVDVFEHVEDFLGFLRTVAPLGERLLCHIPLDMNALAVARGTPIMNDRRQVGHLHYFSKDTALASLRDAGYRVDAHRYTVSLGDLPPRSAKQRIARLPRRIGFRLAPDITARTLGGASLLALCTPTTNDPAE